MLLVNIGQLMRADSNQISTFQNMHTDHLAIHARSIGAALQ